MFPTLSIAQDQSSVSIEQPQSPAKDIDPPQKKQEPKLCQLIKFDEMKPRRHTSSTSTEDYSGSARS